jgi:CheY-like chemotaxis protein
MPRRILFVDDSQIVRRLVRSYLETRLKNIVCAEAVDGLDAIQRAREVAPDLVVLDLCMPKMNGLEAAAVLNGMLPRVPIILFTLHKDIVSDKLANAVGIRAVVSKTDRIEVLFEEILNFVGVARAATA